MSEKFEHSQKFSDEDIKFFNEVAEKYGLDQDEEYLIIRKGEKEIYIPKSRKTPLASGGSIKLEELIQERLAEGE